MHGTTVVVRHHAFVVEWAEPEAVETDAEQGARVTVEELAQALDRATSRIPRVAQSAPSVPGPGGEPEADRMRESWMQGEPTS